MAKPLVFEYAGAEIGFTMTKVDRSKLYGFKELEVLDEKGKPCELATLAGDGRTIVGRGGTGIGYLSADGQWCERSGLKPVDLEGNEIQPVPSSFSAPVQLVERATVEDYLSHNIRAIYQMTTEDDTVGLLAELSAGAIFKFPYSFRGGLEADVGFLLMSADESLFFAVGSPTVIEMLDLQQAAAWIEDDQDDGTTDMDLMDFDMI